MSSAKKCFFLEELITTMIEEIESKEHLSRLKEVHSDFMMILFHTQSSEKSNEALKNLDSFHNTNPDVAVFRVDASRVRDIHPMYGINSVPTLLILKKGRQAETVLGVQSEDAYKRIASGSHHVIKRKGEEKPLKVAVYSSDGCPWCTKAKSYLKKHGIRFRDVNVSHDESAAKDIFRRSGQMGTPQIDINGHIIVGFDQQKIDKLLGLN